MANNVETATWEAHVYEFDINDPIQGGPGGIDNLPHIQLGNRTLFLKQEVDRIKIVSDVAANQMGNVSGAQDLNLAQYSFFSCTITGATTFSFTSPQPGSRAQGFVMEITNGGSAAITWPAAVDWPSGVVPELTVAGVDVLVFLTDDNGTIWRGRVSMLDSK